MMSTTAKSYFWKGMRDCSPFILVAGPFGLLFGVLATEAGLSLVETMTFTMTVFAGAAQFAALQLLQENAPTLIVLASALAVNLRVAMYSAALTPYLGAAPLWQRALVAYFTVDQTYALSIVKFESDVSMSVGERVAYFAGICAVIAPFWYCATLVGALMGASIPDSWALDFALPITFLAMIAPMVRTPAHLVAALVSVVASLVAAGLPYNSGLLVAGFAAMIAGAQTETWLARRGRLDEH